jgi:type IV pilus assembly protein PilW
MLTKNTPRGFSIIELMVSMTISIVVLSGMVYVYSQSRDSNRVNDTAANLQENARFAISVLEPDVQHAGYFGFTNFAPDFQLANGQTVDNFDQLDPPTAGVPASVHACGPNYAIDLSVPIQADNGAFDLGVGAQAAPCVAFGAGPVPGSDTLVIRRAGTVAVAANNARMQVYTSRLGKTAHRIFNDNAAPGPIVANQSDVRDLMTRIYYVSRDSDAQVGVPSLRVLLLGTAAGAPVMQDFELLPGIEDLQVRFGIDALDGNGVATRYVDPDHPLVDPDDVGAVPDAQIVSVQLWLRVRSDVADRGFQDGQNYVYANTNFTPAGADANFHRLLVSRTIQLRNARQL